MSPSLNVEVPVFADTNLGTRFVTAVSPDIRAGDLKRELERAHSICFPELGNIDVSALLVRQKSSFYHLPDSIHVKNACQGFRNPWFLHVYAHPIKGSQRFCTPKHHAGRTSDITHKVTRGKKTDKNHSNHKWRKKRRKRIWHTKALLHGLALTYCVLGNKRGRHILRNCPVRCTPNDLEQKDVVLNGRVSDGPRLEGCHEQQEIQTVGEMELGRMSETPRASSSGVVSVSGIITKYFTNLIELDRPDSPSSSNATSVAIRNQMEGQIQPKMGNAQAIMSTIDMPQFVDEAPQGIVPPPPIVKKSGTDEAPQSIVPPPPTVKKSGTDETPHSNVPPPPTIRKSGTDETPQSIVPPPPIVKKSETDETPQSILRPPSTVKKPRLQTPVVRKCSTEASSSLGTSRAKRKHQQSCCNKPVTSEIPKHPIVASNSLEKSQPKQKSQIGLDRPDIPSCSDAASTAIQPQTEEGQTRPTMGNSHSNMPTNDMPQFAERTTQSIFPIPPTAKKPASQTPVVRKRVRVASNSVGLSQAKLKTRKSCCDQSVTPEVGKRLISASNNLKKSHAKQKSLMCFDKSQNRNMLGSNTRSPVRHLVFEISDDDD